MLERIQTGNILFIDLETVSAQPNYGVLSERMKIHWQRKCKFLLRAQSEADINDEHYAQAYSERAAIFAEFGKIVCISIGYIHDKTQELRMKSFYDKDEASLLRAFVSLIESHYHDPDRHLICGHNIREFDIPYLCRRLLIHSIDLPTIFRLAGKKPWETKHILDTMELWKFGDYKNYTSLDLLAAVLGVETPKDDIDGSMVGQVFWEEDDLDRIARYCEKDVVTVAQVLLRMKGEELLTPEQIVSV